MAGTVGLSNIGGKWSIDTYKAPGPVGAAFLQSVGPIDLIMGPTGSGKTVASSWKAPLLASHMAPICKDGWIHVKCAVIRDTYRDLARTCLKSWHDVFPVSSPYTVDYAGGQDRPVMHHLQWDTIRNGERVPVDLAMEFGAIGDANVEQFIKGYEITYGWCNEADMIDGRVPGLLWQRTGRFPAVDDIRPDELERISKIAVEQFKLMNITLEPDEPAIPRVVWCDFNPPDIDNWTHDTCVENPKPGYNFFWQPGGLSPNAENRAGKPRSSYEAEAATMTDQSDIDRFVHSKFGYRKDGKPVHPLFNLQVHRADEPITPVKGIPLSLGFDFGGTPSCIICQFLPNGQMRVLREIVSEPGTGPSRFSANVLEVLLSDFAGFPVGEAWGDPAGMYGGDKLNSEDRSAMEIVATSLGINLMPTETNDPATRQEALDWYLGKPIDGSTPRFLVDPRCRYIVGGLEAHFKLTKQASAGGTDRMVVVKNMYSHPCEALEYCAYGHRGRASVIREATRMGRPQNVVPIKSVTARSDFDVFSV